MADPKLQQEDEEKEETPWPSPDCYYTALPVDDQDQGDVVLLSHHQDDDPKRRYLILAIFFLALASAIGYILWPSDPEIRIFRLRITRVHVRTWPIMAIDVSLSLTLEVSNADVYFLDFTTLDVAVGYRGKMLGYVTADHGHVRALGSSYVDADVELNGLKVLSDVVHLLDDLADGVVPFDTVTEVTGKFGLWIFRLPLKAKLSCEVTVNTLNRTIARQSCHPG